MHGFLLAAATMVPELIGGHAAIKSEFPEIIYIQTNDAECSATVVGPNVILTAGHCVADQGDIGPSTMLVGHPNVEEPVWHVAHCSQSPQYRDQTMDLDMSLCKMDVELAVKPASISKLGPKMGDSVLLTGYGCIDSEGNGGNDGILRVGKVPVTYVPKAGELFFDTEGSVALCYGDSGGPALLDSKTHLVIGVNSKGNIKDASSMTAMFTPEALKFFADFAKQNQVHICGINKDC